MNKMIDKIKISVIVPVYNVEPYLEECLNSIIMQTLKEIQIIVLDDGSTDRSLKIIKDFAEKDPRIFIESHKNIGLGPTRNIGIRLAKGEYVAFVDSDDYIEKEMLERLYRTAKETECDVVCGEVALFKSSQKAMYHVRESLTNIPSIQITPDTRETFFKDYYFTRKYSHNACDKIYQRQMLIDHEVLFGDNSRIFAEDNWFQLQLFETKPKIGFADHICYFYRQRSDSIMGNYKKNLVSRHMKMINDYDEYLNSHCLSKEDKKISSMLAADCFTMEAINVLHARGNYFQFSQAFKEYNHGNKILVNKMKDMQSLKAYRYGVHWKKNYLWLISFLYTVGCYNIAHRIVWNVYSWRERRKINYE